MIHGLLKMAGELDLIKAALARLTIQRGRRTRLEIEEFSGASHDLDLR